MHRPTSLISFILSVLLSSPTMAMDNADDQCTTLFDFDSPRPIARWETTNDNVMGGKSSGGPQPGRNSLVFVGSTNTDGGGFSSIKSRVPKEEGYGITHFKLRYRGDGRDYKFSAETGERRYLFFRIQYWAKLPTAGTADWQEITLPTSEFVPHYMGKPIRTKGLKGRRIKDVGFFIYDLKDGPFAVEVDWIKACTGTLPAAPRRTG